MESNFKLCFFLYILSFIFRVDCQLTVFLFSYVPHPPFFFESVDSETKRGQEQERQWDCCPDFPRHWQVSRYAVFTEPLFNVPLLGLSRYSFLFYSANPLACQSLHCFDAWIYFSFFPVYVSAGGLCIPFPYPEKILPPIPFPALSFLFSLICPLIFGAFGKQWAVSECNGTEVKLQKIGQYRRLPWVVNCSLTKKVQSSGEWGVSAFWKYRHKQ